MFPSSNSNESTVGPLPKTAADFWQMVFDQQVQVIVMTTKTMERGRVKCHQYWEPTVDETCEYGSFSVKTTAVDASKDYTVASLEIKNTKVSWVGWEIRR
jgi:tyrosine-protein phosphatase non-receptor type 9